MATAARQGATHADQRVVEISTTRDRALLRRFLEQDRLRAAYAICDLEEREFARSKWGIAMRSGEPIAVVLEYGGLTPQPLFVMGEGDAVSAVLREVIRPRLVYLAADESLLPAVERVYRVDQGPQMLRMWVNRQMFRPVNGPVLRLSPVDIVDLNRLYGLGFSGWLPAEAIAHGVYYGVRVAGRLIAAAGTHVVSPEGRLAAVGNVMTHVDFRGRGFAKLTTSAVTQELLRTCDDVVLNVRSDNPPAIAAYRSLGYAEHCRFEERLAHRRGAPWDSILAQLGRLLVRSKEPM
jgi:ribosomal protein S18 acetylase RimI-like enzyme